MVRVIFRTIHLTDEGATVEYMLPSADLKKDGTTWNHLVYLPREVYEDELDAIEDALRVALAAAVERSQEANNQVVVDDDDTNEPGPWEFPPGEGPGAGNGNG